MTNASPLPVVSPNQTFTRADTLCACALRRPYIAHCYISGGAALCAYRWRYLPALSRTISLWHRLIHDVTAINSRDRRCDGASAAFRRVPPPQSRARASLGGFNISVKYREAAGTTWERGSTVAVLDRSRGGSVLARRRSADRPAAR